MAKKFIPRRGYLLEAVDDNGEVVFDCHCFSRNSMHNALQLFLDRYINSHADKAIMPRIFIVIKDYKDNH